LTLFKSGEDALKADRESVKGGSRHSRGLGFVDNPWGEKARQLVKTTCRLDDTHWGLIKEYAFAHISMGGEDSDEGVAGADDDNGATDPHAILVLDW